ncbi:MAG: HlyD family efflux transporter periplasmic adaptor subunit [Alphaproteobacteria bacterium]|nr:HlyD family efflux transporter periplasmic adaptor subunit [Alphaproteobacteria bacterium]
MALQPVKLDDVRPAPSDQPADADASTPPPAAAAAPEKPDFRKRAMPVAGAVVALAVLGFGGEWLINGRFLIKTDNAHIRADITNVAAKVQGYVETLNVEDNQPVKAGDVLLTLEAADYKARVAEAKAALAQAEADAVQARSRIAAQTANVSSTRSRSSAQLDQLAEAEAAARAAEATAQWKTSELKRLTALADKGWYPRARLEEAEAMEKAAQAQAAQARATVTAQQSQVSSSKSSVVQARQEVSATTASATSADARVEAARAKLEAAELDLGRTQIRAPISGIVGNRVVATGQLLSPGQVAMSIVPASEAYVIANYKETQVQHMKRGQRVTLTVDAYPGLKVKGHVESIAPATGSTFSLIPQDTATGNFTKIVQRVPVRIAIDDKKALDEGLMRSGLAVVATVSTKPVKE